MAKRTRKPERPIERRAIDLPPDAGPAVAAPQGSFWNPEMGDTIRGAVVGTTIVTANKGKADEKQVERYQLETDSGDLLTLPDHWDLAAKLKKLAAEHGLPVRVFIGFEGFDEAPNVKSKKLARYAVAPLKE